jgi:hypothetical protein
MNHGALQPRMTWAEDRAPQRCNPSAVPGVDVKTGPNHLARPGHSLTSQQHPREKPEWQDATRFPQGRTLPLANADRLQFQFTLNQDKTAQNQPPEEKCTWVHFGGTSS